MARNRRNRPSWGGYTVAGGHPMTPMAPGTPGLPEQYGGPPSAPAPPPPDWGQIAYETQANRSVQLADAQATYDRGRLQRDFGFNAQGGVDLSNPYGAAAELERSYKQGATGITNSLAAQGQLYSGARQNAQNANTRNYLSAGNDLRNQYSDALNQSRLGQLGTYAQAGGAVTQEQINQLLRALGQG